MRRRVPKRRYLDVRIENETGVGEKMDKLYVLIKAEPGRIEEILDSVIQKRYVQQASAVTGSYDIIVIIEGTSIAEILTTVVKEIHKIDGIKSTETLVNVEF